MGPLDTDSTLSNSTDCRRSPDPWEFWVKPDPLPFPTRCQMILSKGGTALSGTDLGFCPRSPIVEVLLLNQPFLDRRSGSFLHVVETANPRQGRMGIIRTGRTALIELTSRMPPAGNLKDASMVQRVIHRIGVRLQIAGGEVTKK